MALRDGWQGNGIRSDFSDSANKFLTAVEGAVEPVMDKRQRGWREMYFQSNLLAKTILNLPTMDLEYMYFNPKSVGDSGGVQGLHFTPSHGLHVITRSGYHGRTNGQIMFGLREDGVMARAYMPRGPFGPSGNYAQELNDEQSEALADFATSPHTNLGNLAIVMSLTGDEQARLNEQHNHEAQAAQKLRQDLDRIDEMHRRSWESAMTDPTLYR